MGAVTARKPIAGYVVATVLFAVPLAWGEQTAETTYFAGPLWRNLWAGTKTAYTGTHLAALGLAGGPLTLVLHNQDAAIQEHVQDKQPLGQDWTHVGDVLGAAYTEVGMMGALYLCGRVGEKPEIVETTAQMFEGWSIASLSVLTLKPIVGRERPDGSDSFSFPSYHSAGAFSIATTLQLRHGLWAGVPAYAGAAFIAFSRIEANKHYASDVFFGAWLGANAAHAVWQSHRKARERATTIAISPHGVLVTHRF